MLKPKKLPALLLALLLLLSLVQAQAEVPAEALNRILSSLAQETSDPWQKAIYNSTAEDLSLNGSNLDFSLQDFYADIKALPSAKNDPEGFITGFLKGVNSHRQSFTLVLENDTATPKSLNSLKNAVKNAAGKAKGLLNQRDIRAALIELIFPTPFQDAAALSNLNYSAGFDYWCRLYNISGDTPYYAALFYAQSSPKLDASKGPFELQFTLRYTEPAVLLAAAQEGAIKTLSMQYKANAKDEDLLDREFANSCLEASALLRKKPGSTKTFTLSLADLHLGAITSGEYADFLARLTVSEQLSGFHEAVRDLPDAHSQPFPKNGYISGNKSGTKIIINVPNDDYGRYVQLRRASDDALIVDLFINSGGNATVRAPMGNCYLLVASGRSWYGFEGLFGDDSQYSKTDAFEVLSNRYYHTLTLGGVKDGNLCTQGAGPEMFRK